jgi:hypothetical protein
MPVKEYRRFLEGMERVETELRLAEGAVSFVVRTDVPAFREVLPGMGYSAGDGEFTRTFSADVAGLERIYRNFERQLERVLEQAARLRPVPWEAALAELVDRLDATGAAWFVSGSAALAIRGIEIAPRDIDFVTGDHAAVAEALADALVEPPIHDRDRRWIAAWFGRAYLGVLVEWVADVHPEYDDWGAPNEIGPTAASRLESTSWKGRRLLLSPLDLQLAVNQTRGLDDRVEAIRRFEQHG